MKSSLRLPVTDQSEAGAARRGVASWTRELAFGPQVEGSVALVVTELATNLALHTIGGEILLREIWAGERRGVEVLALDQGPGVANFSECLRDGFSTAGTAGTGLGAVRRASTRFEVHSQPKVGTAILSELWSEPPEKNGNGFDHGAASIALASEDSCGDTWDLQCLRSGVVRVILADGLGHGEFAATASRKAVQIFHEGAKLPLAQLIEVMHQAMRSTRGAALAVAEIDRSAGKVEYAGVGNITSTIVNGEEITRLMSYNGTIGLQYRKFQQLAYAWPSRGTLVMQSDGVKADWQLGKYFGLGGRHAALMAGVLYRDFRRPTDDSTIVVLKERV